MSKDIRHSHKRQSASSEHSNHAQIPDYHMQNPEFDLINSNDSNEETTAPDAKSSSNTQWKTRKRGDKAPESQNSIAPTTEPLSPGDSEDEILLQPSKTGQKHSRKHRRHSKSSKLTHKRKKEHQLIANHYDVESEEEKIRQNSRNNKFQPIPIDSDEDLEEAKGKSSQTKASRSSRARSKINTKPENNRKVSEMFASQAEQVKPPSKARKSQQNSTENTSTVIDLEEIDDCNDFEPRSNAGKAKKSVKIAENYQISSKSAAKVINGDEWITAFPPRSLAECCVHAKKLSEIENWLTNSLLSLKNGRFSGNSAKKLLVLAGPSGSCKTTALTLLAGKLGVNLLRFEQNVYQFDTNWAENSLNREFSPNNSGIIPQFKEFLLRGSKYTLGTNLSSGSQSSSALFIDDLPFYPAEYSFSSQLNSQLQRILYSSAQNSAVPIILEVNLGEESANSALKLAELLSPRLIHAPFSQIIHVNPVNVTQMKRAVAILAGKTKISFDEDSVSRIIAEAAGDLRNAVQNLQFLWRTSTIPSEKKGINSQTSENNSNNQKKATASSRNRSNLANSSRANDFPDGFSASSSAVALSQQLLSQRKLCRDINHGLFHSLGSVLYGKLTGTQLNQLISSQTIEPQLFTEFLHANATHFLQNSPDFAETYSELSEFLSFSDLIHTKNRAISYGDSQGEIEFQQILPPLLVSAKYLEIFERNQAKFSGREATNRFHSFQRPESGRIARIARQKRENWLYNVRELINYYSNPQHSNQGDFQLIQHQISAELALLQWDQSFLLDCTSYLKQIQGRPSEEGEEGNLLLANRAVLRSLEGFCDFSGEKESRIIAEYQGSINPLHSITTASNGSNSSRNNYKHVNKNNNNNQQQQQPSSAAELDEIQDF
jgi:hypothetical protein